MSDVKYTNDHEWIKIEGDEALVGITTYARHAFILNFQKLAAQFLKAITSPSLNPSKLHPKFIPQSAEKSLR
jgi:hypothetical protein